jgi:hypothetical protein
VDSRWRRARSRFRAWRRSRPFWGGLVALLGAGELLLPDLAPVKVFLIQGVGAVATGATVVLVVAMVALTWMNVALRQVTGIIVVVLALAAFPLSNLGGFGLGSVLLLFGGSMMVAWVPRRVRKKKRPAQSTNAAAIALVLVMAGTAAVAGARPARADPTPAPSDPAAASASPAPSTGPSGSASPPASTGPSGSASPSGTPSPASPSPSASAKPPVKPVALVDTVVSADPAVVSADTMTVVNMVYRGVAVLHTATGAAVRALWIQADSVTLKPFHQVSDLVPGRGLDTDNATGAAELTGHVTLYVTELTGRLYGLVPIDYTPDNPPPVPYLPLLTVTQAKSVNALIACDKLRLPSLDQHPAA